MNKEAEDNQQTVEDDVSDTDSTSTVEFTASELADRAQVTEPEEEVIEINTEGEEYDDDATEANATGINPDRILREMEHEATEEVRRISSQ